MTDEEFVQIIRRNSRNREKIPVNKKGFHFKKHTFYPKGKSWNIYFQDLYLTSRLSLEECKIYVRGRISHEES